MCRGSLTLRDFLLERNPTRCEASTDSAANGQNNGSCLAEKFPKANSANRHMNMQSTTHSPIIERDSNLEIALQVLFLDCQIMLPRTEHPSCAARTSSQLVNPKCKSHKQNNGVIKAALMSATAIWPFGRKVKQTLGDRP